MTYPWDDQEDDQIDSRPIGAADVPKSDLTAKDPQYQPRRNNMPFDPNQDDDQDQQDQQDQLGQASRLQQFQNGGLAKGMGAAGNIAGGVLAGMQGRQQPQQPLRARYGQVSSQIPGQNPGQGNAPIQPIAGVPTTSTMAPPSVRPLASPLAPAGAPMPPDNSSGPGMAFGGIVSRPTRAILGENGPEAVVPLRPGLGGGNGARMRPSAIPSMGRSKLKMPALPLGKRAAVGS